MSRAGQILERLDAIKEDEYNAEVHVKNDDTIIKNQSVNGRVPLCPTCGHDIIPGHLSPSQVQCPKCFTDVSLADGSYKYRTLSGNTGAHDGIRGDNQYGGM